MSEKTNEQVLDELLKSEATLERLRVNGESHRAIYPVKQENAALYHEVLRRMEARP